MEESKSPYPPEDEVKVEVVNEDLMDFPTAIMEVIKGNKITREDWPAKDYCFLKDSFLSIFTKNEIHTWIVSAGDMEAKDWVITN